MPTITLDKIREDVEKKYEPLVVDFGEGRSVTFVQSLRLPKEARTTLTRSLAEFNEIQARQDASEKARAEATEAGAAEVPAEYDAEAEMLALITEVLTSAAANKRDVAAFLKVVGADFAVLMQVLTEYTTASQLGEASPSAE